MADSASYVSPRLKRQEREIDHSRSSIVEFKNGGAIPPLSHVSSRLGA
jgi:hypothetical protein